MSLVCIITKKCQKIGAIIAVHFNAFCIYGSFQSQTVCDSCWVNHLAGDAKLSTIPKMKKNKLCQLHMFSVYLHVCRPFLGFLVVQWVLDHPSHETVFSIYLSYFDIDQSSSSSFLHNTSFLLCNWETTNNSSYT